MQMIFAGEDITTVVNGNIIYISRAKAEHHRPAGIRGTVIAENGEGIIGAGIRIKGTAAGTVTDDNGAFHLDQVPTNAILEISALGYSEAEVAAAGRQEITVTLKENTRQLDEVVVVAYGTQKKVNYLQFFKFSTENVHDWFLWRPRSCPCQGHTTSRGGHSQCKDCCCLQFRGKNC